MSLLARIMLAFAALAVGTVSIVGILSYRGVEEIVVPAELKRLQATSERLGKELDFFVAGARSDVTAIVEGPVVRRAVVGLLDPGRSAGKQRELEDRLAELFSAELQANMHYLQLRLIGDASGFEVVRVDRKRAGGALHRHVGDQLQPKAQRPYYQSTVRLPAGKVFVSPVELNRERGEIERPPTPVLRVGMPVFGPQQQLFGAVVLNVDMSPAFSAIVDSQNTPETTYLVNSDGDFLVHPDPDVAFAFEFGVPIRWKETMPALGELLGPTPLRTSALLQLGTERVGVATHRVQLAGGPVLQIVRTSEASRILAPALSIRDNTLRSAALALVVALLGAFLIAHSMTRSLRATTRAVARFEPGQILSLPNAGTSEIGTLARTLEIMSRDLRKRMDEEQRMSAQLREIQKLESVGQLAAGISHDFNNLLTIIIGYSNDVLEDLPDESELRGSIDKVIVAAESAAGLTRQLLAFSRQQILQPSILDLNESVRNAEPLLRRLIREDIDMVIRLGDDIGRIRADAVQVEQIVMNLVANARDAMPSGGTLTIEVKSVEFDAEYVRHHADARVGAHVCIAVSDSGVGMDPGELEKIFDPFYTTKALGRGTGLGLSTVYGIVKQSGGHIWVYSEPQSGTTFKIYMPCVDEAEALASSRARSSARSRPSLSVGKETILLVEDDASLRELVARTLVKGGYLVHAVANGEAAIEAYSRDRHRISLLLTDVVLPGLSGRQIADALLALEPNLVVVFMSGYTDDSIVHRGVLEHGTNFIEKPIAPRALLERIREILDAASSGGR